LHRFVSWKLTAPDLFLSRCQRLLLLWACGQRVSVVHHVHSLRGLHPFAPDRHRRAIAECLMKATIVVEGDPVCDSCLGLAAVGIALEIGEWRGALQPRALSEPDVNLSIHPAPVIQPLIPQPSERTGLDCVA
jgi:hypothetical protein